jgi:hypothetical protein
MTALSRVAEGNTDAGAVFPFSTEQGAPMRARSANSSRGSTT